MSDPLTYMNEFCTWSNPPEPDERWELSIAKACVEISARDKTIASLRSQLKQERRLTRRAEVAMREILNVLNARIKEASRGKVPVFDGIANVHSALNAICAYRKRQRLANAEPQERAK